MSESAKNHRGHLTSGRLLAKNTVWNLFGSGAPMLVAVVCIPILIKGLGKERFGVLTLAWALIGYASLFDLGLGRALTQLVARKLGTGEEKEIPSLTWTSLLLMLLLGIAGAAVVFAISPWLALRALNIPDALDGEALQTFRLLGISLPFVITTAGLRGLLEAHQRFGLTNALRIPMGVFTFAGPLLVLPFTKDLVPVISVLVAGRVIGWGAHLLLCLRVAPELRRSIAWERGAIGPLIRFGGWMTVSNVVSPLMVTLDRFLIGGLVSVTAVAYYATPYEVVTKFWVLPSALLGVMFPAFSASFARDPEHTALLFRRSLKTVFVVLFPIMLCTVALASEGLKVWLGAEFAQHSYRVLQILAVGVFINSLAQVPFWLLQGVGRPDLCATLHLIELPLYLGLLWWLIGIRGIEGAAIAWTTRVAVDAVFLFGLARRFLPGKGRSRLRAAFLPAAALGILTLAALLQGPLAKGFFLLATILCFALVTWFWILMPEERTLAQTYHQRERMMLRRISNRLSKVAKAPGNALSLLRCTREIRALNGYSNPRNLADFCFRYPIGPQQIPEEMINLFEIVSELKPNNAMEIGTYNGGTLFMTCRLAEANATIISVDLPGGRFGQGYAWPRSFVYRNFAKDNQSIHLLRRNSHDMKTNDRVRFLLQGKPLDFLHIDGDHSYEGVRADFEMYSPLVRRGGVVAFHDIVSHPPETGCEVDRFWKEIKRTYRHIEIIKDPLQGWAGIGVLYM